MSKSATVASETSLESIAAAQADAAARRRQRYREMVRALADEKPLPPAGEVAELLDQLGLKAERMKCDVELLKSRRLMRVRFDQKPAAEAAIPAAKAAGQAESKRFAPLLEEHHATIRQLDWQVQKATTQLLDAESAKGELMQSCKDERAEAYRDAEKRLRALFDKSEELKRRSEDAAHKAAGSRTAAENYAQRGHSEDAAEQRRAAEGYQTFAKSLDAQQSQLAAEIASAEREVELALAAVLEP